MGALLPLLLLLAQAPSQPPTFKTGVNLVEVDVVVTDRDGRPVRGLTREDFEIAEDGVPMEVATFSAVDLPAAPAGDALPPASRSGSAAATNDHPEDGRIILIVLDDYHVSFDAGRFAVSKAIARRLVERLGPSDQAAVITSSGSRAGQAEFTGDKARLLDAIDKFFPQAESRATGVAERPSARAGGAGNFGFVHEIKARWAMDTLSNAARALALIPHRRKSVLLVSQGLPADLETIITNPSAGGAFQALRDFILTAQRSNIAVYPVDPCGLDLDDGCSNASRDNLRSIAEGTGGFAVTNTNAPETGVDRMIEENGAYYLIAYYSPAPPDDGRRHRIRVRTRVAGAQVRAREGYVNERKSAKPAAAAAPLDALIAAPIQRRGLPLRLVAVPLPLAEKPGAGVVLGIELLSAAAVQAGKVEFSVAAFDDRLRSRAHLRFTSTFESRASTPSGWTRVATRLDLQPGRYHIRLAAASPENGTQGSVFADVVVPKFDGPLSPGGLSLGIPAAAPAEPTPAGGGLPLLPLAAHEVSANDSVSAQLPLRVAPRSGDVLSIVTTLRGPDGTARQLDSTSMAAREYAGPGGRVYQIALPTPLAPGDHTLTVEMKMGRQQVVRELVFSARRSASEASILPLQ
jgi:VWFA-related protein